MDIWHTRWSSDRALSTCTSGRATTETFCLLGDLHRRGSVSVSGNSALWRRRQRRRTWPTASRGVCWREKNRSPVRTSKWGPAHVYTARRDPAVSLHIVEAGVTAKFQHQTFEVARCRVRRRAGPMDMGEVKRNRRIRTPWTACRRRRSVRHSGKIGL